MKEKISDEKRNLILQMNRFRRQMVCLLQGILDQNQCSDAFSQLGAADPFYDDSCAVVNLRLEIVRLAETLDKMADYEDKLLTDYYE